jgi:hypothetical protein
MEDDGGRDSCRDCAARPDVAALDPHGWTAARLRFASAELYEMGTIYVLAANAEPLISHLQSLGHEVVKRLIANGLVALGLARITETCRSHPRRAQQVQYAVSSELEAGQFA